MNGLSAILRGWRDAGPDVRDAVLATVVHVRGSAYRRPGARMLIRADGTRVGTISGGCLEADVVRKAWWWTDAGATIRVFDNTTEDAAHDFGLGCNGVITVLLERVETEGSQRLLEFLEAHQARREGVVVSTVVRAAAGGGLSVGDRGLYDQAGIAGGARPPLVRALANAVRATFAERRSRLAHLAQADVFVEWVGPPQRLLVFGSGHDVVPLATIAGMMGWNLTVADFRSPHLQPGRLPAAERIFAIPSSGDLSDLRVTGDDAVVIMTHNYAKDAVLLPQLLAASPCYLGLLGPRARAERLFKDIGVRDIGDNVHAPIGLAIGGEHPESIALSITSEIQAVLHDQPGGFLRHYSGPIHAEPLELGVAAPVPAWTPDATIQPSCNTAIA